jgi:hypothetical protein
MVRVWEYEVADRSRAEFEHVYGADGAWAQLFASSSGFEGTELFVSVSHPGRYLTVDRFSDESAWRRFLDEHREEYLGLDARTGRLTRSERELVGPAE